MTFEEFFQKKKISLVALEQGEPSLFSEFKVHFEKMGEKSFDHTKKYWFNKLRLRFPTPPEAKVEKMAIENPLAEQTINETLSEAPSLANVGFKPRFKAAATKPAVPLSNPEAIPGKPAENTEQTTPSPTLGFKPKFKAGVTKPSESSPNTEPVPSETPVENSEQEAPKPAIGFKPKFKAGITKTTQPVREKTEEPKEETPPANQSAEDTEAKPAYKPRFNMKNIKPKEEE